MLAELLKKLQLLPYPDMMVLAKALEDEFKGLNKPTAVTIAQSLAKVSVQNLPSAEVTRTDHQLLLDLFSRRRSISVKAMNGGFDLELQTLHAHVPSRDLRDGLIQIVDTVVAARALRGDT
jgi:hypothetical protein